MTASSGKKITNLYLVDGSVPDYKRLKNEGYEPLVRKSIKHRLAFETTALETSNADVDGDGAIDINDVTALIDLLLATGN